MSDQAGIVKIAVMPLRSGPSDRDEMVSQLLFGEMVRILEVRRNWTLVTCEWDGYQGWCDTKQVLVITEENYNEYRNNHSLAFDMLQQAVGENHFINLPIGATLPKFDGLRLQISEQHYRYSGQVITAGQFELTPDLMAKIARRYLYTPYLWGGRSPLGIDCSGFTQIVYKLLGIRLLRDASQQVSQGRLVDFMHEVQAGDLAFFENDKGKITHVGMLMSPDTIIHGYGWVRLDAVDHFGIFNYETRRYTHKLRIVRRHIADFPSAPIAEPKATKQQTSLSFF